MHETRKKTIVVAGFLFLSLALVLAPRGVGAAGSAALFISPSAGTLLVGSTFDVSILLDTKGTAVNTIEVELLFPADKMQIANPSVGRSIIQIWPASPLFSNKEGRVYFVGGVPSPGIATSQGVVLTLTFRVIAPGQAELRFGEKTAVLANDGNATDVLGQRPSSFYTFQIPAPQGPVINSSSHPDQEKWYRDPNPVFVWAKSQFADGYSYEIDQNPSGFPDTVSEGAHSTASFQNLADGLWYFHLRERAGGVWGGVSHYLVRIDNEAPASFRVNVSPGTRTAERSPVLRFFTTDALSGLSHYELKVVPLRGAGGSEALFFEVSSTYQLAALAEGRYQMIVRALDRAGNARDEAVTVTILGTLTRFVDPEGVTFLGVFIPWVRIITMIGGIVLLSVLILAILWRRHRHKVRHTFAEDVRRFVQFLKGESRRAAPHALLLLLLVPTVLGALYLVPKGSNTTVARLKEAFAFQMARDAAHRALGSVSAALALLSQNVAPETSNTAPSITVAPVVYYPLDETLYLEGVAPSKSNIVILFEKPGSQPVRVRAESNSNGEWFFSDTLELAGGNWMVRARVADDPPSDWSNPRIIQSAISGFMVGTLKIKFIPIVLILGALFVVASALLSYSFFTMHKARTRAARAQLLEKDKQLAASYVEQHFSGLRRKVTDALSHRNFASRENARAPDEDEHRAELLKELDEVEEKLEKQVKGII